MVIRASDRVSRVLDRDETLLEVFAAASPHFERLRNPAIRRVMSRLVTVEQAARMAGVEPDTLIDRLNRGAAATCTATSTDAAQIEQRSPMTDMQIPTTVPPELERYTDDRIVELDVREDLRNGREPFSRIMAAKQALMAGDALRLRATFEPVPLYRVLEQQGFGHWTRQNAPDDWEVLFYREAEVEVEPSGATPGTATGEPGVSGAGPGTPAAGDDGVVILDVRGLEPPEPMVRTLAALERLPPGATLVQINVRVPQFLIPRLEKLGWEFEIRQQADDLVRVFIRRPA